MPALPFIAAGISMFGQGTSMLGQEKTEKYNAAIEKRNATQEELIVRDRGKNLLGSQRALYAKAGVDLAQGSPLLVAMDTASDIEMEALDVRYGGASRSKESKFKQRAIGTSGAINMGSTVLTGLTDFYKQRNS